jgi:nucleotide-binding universal stress UspA family protein
MTDERIVVGVDGSDASMHALRWAHHLATPLGASIDVFSTWETPPLYVSPIADDDTVPPGRPGS